MSLTVAIIGRPNVGKSTFFNRLARKKLAIIDDRPGITRDWRAAEATLYDRTIGIIDTAGLEEAIQPATGPADSRRLHRAAAGRHSSIVQ